MILLYFHRLWEVSNYIGIFHDSLMPTDFLTVAFMLDDYINWDAD